MLLFDLYNTETTLLYYICFPFFLCLCCIYSIFIKKILWLNISDFLSYRSCILLKPSDSIFITMDCKAFLDALSKLS